MGQGHSTALVGRLLQPAARQACNWNPERGYPCFSAPHWDPRGGSTVQRGISPSVSGDPLKKTLPEDPPAALSPGWGAVHLDSEGASSQSQCAFLFLVWGTASLPGAPAAGRRLGLGFHRQFRWGVVTSVLSSTRGGPGKQKGSQWIQAQMSLQKPLGLLGVCWEDHGTPGSEWPGHRWVQPSVAVYPGTVAKSLGMHLEV